MVPLEAAYKAVKREFESEYLPKITSCIESFESFISNGARRSFETNFHLLKRDGDAKVEETVSAIRKAWEQACQEPLDYIRDFDESLKRLRTTSKTLQELAKDPHRNRLVDKCGDFKDIQKEISESWRASRVSTSGFLFRRSEPDVQSVLSPWLPIWDVEVSEFQPAPTIFVGPFPMEMAFS